MRHRSRRITLLALALFAFALLSLVARPARSEDAKPAPAFREGDVLTAAQIDQLRPFLPPEFWANRDFFFYEGMRLEIGPAFRDYAPAQAYVAATRRYAATSKLGPESSLEGYVAGQPFPIEQVDCSGDPQAGAKIIWDFDAQWEGDGADARFYYSYWDRGEQLPLFFEGTSKAIALAHRVEPEYLANAGDVFRDERRKGAFGIEVDAPFDARGLKVLSYRYKASDGPRATTRNDDTWVYVPALRRVRRISTAQRADAVSGTDFTFDDLRSFAGIVPQYSWECLGEQDLIAPMNSKVAAYPYERDHAFGPYGLSYADDRWELRHAIKIRMTPNNPDHPYHHKDLYLDEQTLVALYSFAYDRKGELWKIIWHNHRWSDDDLPQDAKPWYAGWSGVEQPRDLRVVSDTIVNVQTGTGNRIEFWNAHGTPFRNKGMIRGYIDVGRLARGGH